MSPAEKAALDTLLVLAGVLVIFCVGAWFGWMAREAKYRSEHVTPPRGERV